MGVLSIYMSKPKIEHWIVANRVFMSLRCTMDYAICYKGKPETDKKIYVHGFVDFD